MSNSPDIERNGFLIDGFPRSASQVAAVMEDPQWAALRPDCVISLIRPVELIKEFALGRCPDAAPGQTYHPVYAPAPEEVRDRLVGLTLPLTLTTDRDPNRDPNPNPDPDH
jgi:adenylate kinase family enzyme